MIQRFKSFFNFQDSAFLFIVPLFVLSLYSVGRGVGNTALFLYFVIGLFSMRLNDVRQYRMPILIWIGLVLTMLISSYYNGALDDAKKQLILFSLSSMVLLFTLNIKLVAINPRIFQIVFLIPLLSFLLKILYFYWIDDFHPEYQAGGMDIPILFSLILIPILLKVQSKETLKIIVFFLGVFFILLIILQTTSKVYRGAG